jgi:hypothetical protein
MEVNRMKFGPTRPTNSVQISPQSYLSLPGTLLLRKSFNRDLRQDFDLNSLFSDNHVHITQLGLLKLTRTVRTIPEIVMTSVQLSATSAIQAMCI